MVLCAFILQILGVCVCVFFSFQNDDFFFSVLLRKEIELLMPSNWAGPHFSYPIPTFTESRLQLKELYI